MTLPVSSYEELLARVRNLTHETIQLQRELLDHNDNERLSTQCDNGLALDSNSWSPATDERNRAQRSTDGGCSRLERSSQSFHNVGTTEALLARLTLGSKAIPCNKEGSMEEPKEEDEKKEKSPEMKQELLNPDGNVGNAARLQKEEDYVQNGVSCSSTRTNLAESSVEVGDVQLSNEDRFSALYHGTWPVEHSLWHSGPSSIGNHHSLHNGSQDASSVMSFNSSAGVGSCVLQGDRRSYSSQQLGHKVEMVYGLLSMLQHERQDMSRTLLAMSSSPDSCAAMRQSGCLPLLVQLLHSPGQNPEVRARAAQALKNVVQSNPDQDRRGRREARVLRLLEQLRDYCEQLRSQQQTAEDEAECHPGPAIAALMKLSFDEEHRHAMCQLGGLHAVAELIQMDHEAHGSATPDHSCVTLRRYAGMALTNLTFGDGANKALLCSLRPFMRALVAQLASPSEDLRQVTASVLRNLSWRADGASKAALREVGAVPALVRAAMGGTKEATLKSILSALWNLSAHCSMNKVDVCAVDGALGFLVDMLTYKAPSKTLAIVENAGGILRNISSHIAVREDYRAILREHHCLPVLLQQLKSPSLTVVSNACGALWNLSARCPQDQKTLWDLGAVGMLRSLVHSKHKMISMGSSAALKNLLAARPPDNTFPMDVTARGLGLPQLPSLYVRKQRALEQELDQTLSETCDNIEPSTSPPPLAHSFQSESHQNYHMHRSVTRSESRDSVVSTQSDSVFERARCLHHPDIGGLPQYENSLHSSKLMQRYCGAVPEEQLSCLIREKRSHSLPHPVRHGHTGDVRARRLLVERRVENTAAGEQEKVNHSSSISVEIHPSSPPALSKMTGGNYETSGTVAASCDFSNTNTKSKGDAESQVQVFSSSTQVAEISSSRSKSGYNYKKKLNSVYGDYAETDLDQPTDYSLQYQEEEEETESASTELHNTVQERSGYYPDTIHEDTLKTYCTEGTPYETPYNFSTATSMSDLHCEPPTPHSEEVKEDDVPCEDTVEECRKPRSISLTVEVHRASEEDQPATVFEPELDNSSPAHSPPTGLILQSSGLSSGLMSPEKPVAYCEEGTPAAACCFSRVSSLSSLASHTAEDQRSSSTKPIGAVPSAPIVTEELKETREAGSCNNKVVTFAGAEETPLMFSRCSSLGSLSSFEQHSIHDDRSSVISDFSRRTSGAVSPSDLPDSPTQTVPPSPGPRLSGSRRGPQSPLEFSGRPPERNLMLPAARHHGSRTNAPKSSVFEDDVAAFKEEDTPVEFSRATSLSSLTIDDEPKISSDAILKETRSQRILATDEGTEKQDREKSDCGELAPVSEGEEDADEDILAACISVGMPGSTRQHQLGSSETSLSRPRATGDSSSRPTGIPLKTNINNKKSICPTKVQQSYVEVGGSGPCEDAVQTYCTEGTPAAVLSHAGSHSDLSILSMPGGDLSDDNISNLSGAETDNILAECIQSGMPKAKQTPSSVTPLPRKIYSDVQKPTVTSRTRTVLPLQGARDELELYTTEDSPNNFSMRSSLSDLTTNSGELVSLLRKPQLNRPLSESNACVSSEERQLQFDKEDRTKLGVPHAASFISLNEQKQLAEVETNNAGNIQSCSVSEDIVTVLSRNGSLSSLSVDSFGSAEPTPSEQALLEQCISSGMPKSRSNGTRRRIVPASGCKIPLPVDRILNVGLQKLELRSHSSYSHENSITHLESGIAGLSLDEEESGRNSFPKNVGVPPAAPNVVAGGGGGKATTTAITTTNTTLNGTSTSVPAKVPETNETIDTLDYNFVNTHSTLHDSVLSKPTTPTASPNTSLEPEIVMANEDNCVEIHCESRELNNSQNELDFSADKSDGVVAVEGRNNETPPDFEKQDIGKLTPSSPVATKDSDAMIASLDRITEELLLGIVHKDDEPGQVMRQSATSGDTWNEEISPNEVSFPSLSVSAPCKDDGSIIHEEESSTTDSNVIALEAGRLAAVISNNQTSSEDSADLDAIRPPSMMASLVSMTASLDVAAEDEAVTAAVSLPANVCNQGRSLRVDCRHKRKRSLPAGMMVRRALGNGSGSVESLPLLFDATSASSSCNSHLDNIKPPSAMEEIGAADMENSMVSVASITSEVADPPPADLITPFANPTVDTHSVNADVTVHHLSEPVGAEEEDTLCSDYTEIDDPAQTYTLEDEKTECVQHLNHNKRKRLTPKQKREIARDRYRTYTINGDEVVITENKEVKENECGQLQTTRVTPKQRRQDDRMRFQTQVLDKPQMLAAIGVDQVAATDNENDNVQPRNVINIKQKRAEAKDRFRTQTLNEEEIKFLESSPKLDSCLQGDVPGMTTEDVEGLLEHNANIVIEGILQQSSSPLLDWETLSLVSIDSESEQNISNGRKPTRKAPFPEFTEDLGRWVSSEEALDDAENTIRVDGPNCDASDYSCNESSGAADDEEGECKDSSGNKRPQVVKPSCSSSSRDQSLESVEGSPKPVRGRRKALYSSNKVNSGIPVRPVSAPQSKVRQVSPKSRNVSVTNKKKIVQTPSIAPAQNNDPRFRPPERQGTFTKEEAMCTLPPVSPTKTKIPIPATIDTSTFKKQKKVNVPVSKPSNQSSITSRNKQTKLLTKDSTSNNYSGTKTRVASKPVPGNVNRRSLPSAGAEITSVGVVGRSSSNSSLSSTSGKRKEVTSKIASLWKKVEENKNKQKTQKKDGKVWIGGNNNPNNNTRPPGPIRSSTFEGPLTVKLNAKKSKSVTESRIPTAEVVAVPRAVSDKPGTKSTKPQELVTMRKPRENTDCNPIKRLSRLGSFVRADTSEDSTPTRPASAVVSPFNYNPHPPTNRSQIPTPVKRGDAFPVAGDNGATEELNTASIRVTTV